METFLGEAGLIFPWRGPEPFFSALDSASEIKKFKCLVLFNFVTYTTNRNRMQDDTNKA